MIDFDAARTRAAALITDPGYQRGSLGEKYLQPPYSILDSRKGDWLERRRWWLTLGIRSEIGRGGDDPAAVIETASPALRSKMRRKRGRARAVSHDMLKGEGVNVAPGNAPRRRGTHARGAISGVGLQEMGLGAAVHATSRAEADQASNVRGTADMPDWARDVGMERMAPGTSIFDPVLCELMYRWFAPVGGHVLDPFAGGSVRGIVASVLGHPYTGIELREEQVASNREQADTILRPMGLPVPHWIVGDSTHLDELLPAGQEYDMVFTCPPYYDLEVYSDDPRDLSALDTYSDFLQLYRVVAAQSMHRLRHGHHAVWVVSEIRDTEGTYRGLVPDTISALVAAGGRFYNEAILLNSVGSGALRAERQFGSSRKLVRTHQNIVGVVKGEVARGFDAARPSPPDPQLALFVLDQAETMVAAPPASPQPAAPATIAAMMQPVLPPAPPAEPAAPPDSPPAGSGPVPAPVVAPAQAATPEAPAATLWAAHAWLSADMMAAARFDAEAMEAWHDAHPPAGAQMFTRSQSLEHNYAARCAELAVAMYTGLQEWPFVVGDGGHGNPDVGLDIEVRSSRNPSSPLRLYPRQPLHRKYVLVTGTAPALTIHGWAYGHEVQDAGQWMDPAVERSVRKACWALPQRLLRDPSTITTTPSLQPPPPAALPAGWYCQQCGRPIPAGPIVEYAQDRARALCEVCDAPTEWRHDPPARP